MPWRHTGGVGTVPLILNLSIRQNEWWTSCPNCYTPWQKPWHPLSMIYFSYVLNYFCHSAFVISVITMNIDYSKYRRVLGYLFFWGMMLCLWVFRFWSLETTVVSKCQEWNTSNAAPYPRTNTSYTLLQNLKNLQTGLMVMSLSMADVTGAFRLWSLHQLGI
jgi:hypothetical protein